jgi:hypothetical protein
MSDDREVIDWTQRWVSEMVIGRNLCPFAKRVFDGGLIRYAVTPATDEEALIADLDRELRSLAATPRGEIETTLLIHPRFLRDFLDYNDFLDVANQRLRALRLQGVIQIASFHPDYQFADTTRDAVENFTNRSPFPMLHLLREESVSEVATDPDRLLEIPRRNVEMLQQLGQEGIQGILRRVMPRAGSSKPHSEQA